MADADGEQVDVAIFGGGIAGVWMFNLLRARGYRVLLLTRGLLGRGQTMWSQGMIHGGVKYSLIGEVTEVSNTIAAMPARWREHFDGLREPDLSGVPLLSERYYMFSNASRRSQLLTFLGSRALRGRIERLDRDAFPAAFANPDFRGTLYQLQDIVVDVPKVLERLSAVAPESVYDIGAADISLERAASGWRVQVGEARCTASRCLFAAGDGNEALLRLAGIDDIQMQRRSMQQVLVRHPQLTPLYAHYVGSEFRFSPLLTLSTHYDSNGESYWAVGGDVATGGADLDAAAQLDRARCELHRLLPWLVPTDARWETVSVSVAEPEAGGRLPSEPFVQLAQDTVVVWPTKLTLIPLMADRVLACLSDLQPTVGETPSLRLPQSRVAVSAWEANGLPEQSGVVAP